VRLRKRRAREGQPRPRKGELSTYDRLLRFLLAHRGQFALGIVRVNNPRQRDGLVASMRERLAREGMQLCVLDFSQRQIHSLYEELTRDQELRACLREHSESTALALVGLEGSIDTPPYPGGQIPAFLAALNLQRDNISTGFHLPVTLWLNDYSMDQLAEGAPDFFDYYAGLFTFRSVVVERERPLEPQARESLVPPEQEVSAEFLEERIDLLQGRLMELKRKGPLDEPDRERLAQLLEQLGEVYYSFRDKGAAITYFKQATRAFAELEDKDGTVRSLTRLADSYNYSYQYEAARRRYEEALPIYREIGDRRGEANTIWSLGNLDKEEERPEVAWKKYERALAIYREVGARLGEANVLRTRGM